MYDFLPLCHRTPEYILFSMYILYIYMYVSTHMYLNPWSKDFHSYYRRRSDDPIPSKISATATLCFLTMTSPRQHFLGSRTGPSYVSCKPPRELSWRARTQHRARVKICKPKNVAWRSWSTFTHIYIYLHYPSNRQIPSLWNLKGFLILPSQSRTL